MATKPTIPARPAPPPKPASSAAAVAAANAAAAANGRDLKDIAKKVAANPSLAKRFLRSSAFSSYRRLGGKGALSGVLKMGQTVVSAGLGNIPIPGVSGLLERAFDNTCNTIRSAIHNNEAKKHSYAVAPEDRIKFELKELGATVADWDGYRWKVTHAVAEYTKATTEIVKADYGGRPPCDAWVRVWAKYFYLHSRIKKFKTSLVAVAELTKELDKWLDSVDDAATKEEAKLDAAYQTALTNLRALPADDHKECSDYKCMFKSKSWTSATYVPTSNEALYLIQGAKYVWSWGVGDPLGTASSTGVGQASTLAPNIF